MSSIPPQLTSALRQAGLTPEQATMLEGLPERQLLRIDVPGRDAWRHWQHFRSMTSETGFWPVLVGSPEGPDFVFRQMGFFPAEDDDPEWRATFDELPPPAGILASAEQLTFEHWLAQRRDPQWWARHYLAEAERIEQSAGGASSLSDLYRRFAEEWRTNPPRDPPIEEYAWLPESEQLGLQDRPATLETFDAEYRRVVADTVALVLCPVAHGWQVPALLPFDPVEDHDRPPELHVAALRWLAERNGAELVGIGDRTLDVLPKRRPATEREALLLARDVNLYATCPWTGDENTRVPQWAAFLMRSPLWSLCFVT